MEDVKSILVASERLFGCESDPSEMMRQTRIVAEVWFFLSCCCICLGLHCPSEVCALLSAFLVTHLHFTSYLPSVFSVTGFY